MELKNLRVMITGGAGFIGSHLADALLEMGNTVICYDDFNSYYTGKERNVQHNLNNPNYHLIKADVLDFDNLFHAIHGVDVIFHLAAQAGIRYSVEHPQEVAKINIMGTLILLNAARQQKVKKIIFASSSSVYGNPQYMPTDENHPTNPISPYGASKLSAEKYCLIYHKLYNMNIVILRYFTVYGPRQRPDMAIRKFIRLVFNNKPPVIYGDGTQTRDFTYVDDIIQGTVSVAEMEDVDGEIFNLGGGHSVSVRHLVQLLIELAGKEGKIQPEYVPAKLGDVKDTHADITKARNFLRYEPQSYLENGLRNFLEWYKMYT